ncbi:MAG: serine hydrolase, partial [Bacteroidota bacterium]
TMSEILEYTVSLSDNMGCDLLFELVGGTEVVDAYLHQIGITNIAVVHTEMVMQSIWDSQYDNWTTAKAANWALQLFFENANELLSDKSYQFLLSIMKNTKTGQKSIKGNLPTDVIVAHKTGYSGVNSEGLTGALNDIGIVFLPNDSHFYISVLVSNSMEDYDTNQKIIADIAKVAWDYFNR